MMNCQAIPNLPSLVLISEGGASCPYPGSWLRGSSLAGEFQIRITWLTVITKSHLPRICAVARGCELTSRRKLFNINMLGEIGRVLSIAIEMRHW